MSKKAIIFGVTGQDGSFLTEFLLSKGYIVYGVARRVSTHNDERLRHIKDENFIVLQGDITDANNVNSIVGSIKPDEVYNLAAQSHVRISFDEPSHSFEVTAQGTMNVLESIRQLSPSSRYYQAGSSEMFGDAISHRGQDGLGFQNEDTPFNPQSPYAVAKLAAHHMTKIYRSGYKLFACNGILFNHESERRGDLFVSRKITLHIASLRKYVDDRMMNSDFDLVIDEAVRGGPVLSLGNTSSYRDWGYAPDYCKAMWLMLQVDKPDDYVISTGEAHTVQEFLIKAFQHSLGYYSDSLIKIDPALYRAAEVNYLCGDFAKAKSKLNWEPTVKFDELVKLMVDNDLKQNVVTWRN